MLPDNFRKKLIMSAFPLLMTFVLLVTATVAWFSANRDVDSNGMEMQVDTTANLVIAKTEEDIKTTQLASVTFTTNDDKYKPTTHDADYTTFPNGLKHVTNTGKVDFSTGLVAEGVFASSVNSDDMAILYYKDYVVYIASAGKSLTSASLTASITLAKKGDADVSEGTLMATSIDFYVGDVASTTYKGTSNVATKGSVTLVNNGTIPLNSADSNNYIKVTMRCYFDGALQIAGSAPAKAYVNSATLDVSKVKLNVHFTATGTES